MKFFRKFKKYKIFHIEPGVYLYPNDQVCNRGLTSRIKWLEKFYVSAKDEEESIEIAIDSLKHHYPNWNVHIF